MRVAVGAAEEVSDVRQKLSKEERAERVAAKVEASSGGAGRRGGRSQFA